MSFLSKNDKSQLVSMGAGMVQTLFNDFAEESRAKRQKALSDNHISKEEYDDLYNQMLEYQSYVENIFNDTELGSKFRETEEHCLTIIRIIALDLEHDYHEVIQNFNRFIDNDEFIESHKQAMLKREDRLDEEYQMALQDYELELAEHQSKGFWSKAFSSAPERPQRRE